MTQNVGRLGVVLGIDTAQFVAGLEKAKKSITEFAVTNMPRLATAGAAAFAAMTYKALQFSDQMADVAKANDVAIETVLQLSQALTVSGGRAADASKLFASFSAQVDSAAQGSKGAQELFSRVGVSLSDLAKLTNEELFDKVLQELAKIDDALTRNALAAQIFGRAMKGVDVRELAAQTREGREEFRKYAEAIKEAGEFQDKLDTALNKITLSFTKNVLPTVTRLAEELGKAGGVMETVFKAVDYFISHTAFGIRFLAGVIEATFEALKSLGSYIGDLMSLNFNTAQQRLKEYLDKSKKIQEEVKAFGEKLFATPGSSQSAQPSKPAGGPVRDVINADAEAVKKAKELSVEFIRQQSLKLEQLSRQKELLEMTAKEKELAEAMFSIEQDRRQKIYDIDKRIAEERAKARPSREIISALEEEKEAVNSLAVSYKDLTKNIIEEQQKVNEMFSTGWNKAFKQYSEDAQNYSRFGEQAFNTVVSSMDAALSTFIKTGKLNFKDFARSIIQDLLMIQLRMQAMQLFGSLFPGAGMGTQSPAPITTITIPKANGGDVDAMKPYYVGERGPEVFVPNMPGTIVPNHRISDVAGGQTYVTNNYIDAIDVKSFEDRLLSSSNTVWAANQYANKSLAQPGGRA